MDREIKPAISSTTRDLVVTENLFIDVFLLLHPDFIEKG
jgi:hypothetical protein